MLWELFQLIPTPEAAAAADPSAIEKVIWPLGLFRKRAVMVHRFSMDYLEKQVVHPALHPWLLRLVK